MDFIDALVLNGLKQLTLTSLKAMLHQFSGKLSQLSDSVKSSPHVYVFYYLS